MELLKDVISDFLEDLLLCDHWKVQFQDDGDTPHKISNAQQYIRDKFQQQVISCGDCVECSPRLPALLKNVQQKMQSLLEMCILLLKNTILRTTDR